MTGRGEVAGDLEGERAAGGEGLDPTGEGFRVVGDPLERRVGDDQVVGFLGRPVGGVGEGEVEVAAARGETGVVLGLLEHLRGVVVSGDVRIGPACGEQGGDVSGAAAEVGDTGGAAGPGEAGYPGEKVVEGAGTVPGVAEVLLRIPGWCVMHDRNPFADAGLTQGWHGRIRAVSAGNRAPADDAHSPGKYISTSRDFMSTDPLH